MRQRASHAQCSCPGAIDGISVEERAPEPAADRTNRRMISGSWLVLIIRRVRRGSAGRSRPDDQLAVE